MITITFCDTIEPILYVMVATQTYLKTSSRFNIRFLQQVHWQNCFLEDEGVKFLTQITGKQATLCFVETLKKKVS